MNRVGVLTGKGTAFPDYREMHPRRRNNCLTTHAHGREQNEPGSLSTESSSRFKEILYSLARSDEIERMPVFSISEARDAINKRPNESRRWS